MELKKSPPMFVMDQLADYTAEEILNAEGFLVVGEREMPEKDPGRVREAASLLDELFRSMGVTARIGRTEEIIQHFETSKDEKWQLSALRIARKLDTRQIEEVTAARDQYRDLLPGRGERSYAEMESALKDSEEKTLELLENLDDMVFRMQVFADEDQITPETKDRILTIVHRLKQVDEEHVGPVIQESIMELLQLRTREEAPVLQGAVLYANETAEKNLGFSRSEHLGNITMMEMIEPDEIPRALATTLLLLRQHHQKGAEHLLKTAQGGRWNVSINSHLALNEYPFVVEGVARDISEKKRLEEQLVRSQKMELVGQLAAGVAHDLNNHLVAILGGAEMILSQLDFDHPMREEVKQVVEAADRMSRTVRSLLDFSSQRELREEKLDLRLEIARNERMFRRIVTRDNVDFRCSVAPDIYRVKMDPTALNRALMNLVVNANDALPEGGAVDLEVTNASLENALKIKARHAVQIKVQDNGVGIPEKLQEKIFEPFFTTKGPDKGTGLGLAQVFGLVRSSGGEISVESQEGVGTTFIIVLPAIPGKQSSDSIPAVRFSERPVGSGNVAVVEDDVAVRRSVFTLLSRSGFKTLAYDSADTFLSFLKEKPDAQVDVVLSDVMMAGTSGIRLAEKIKAIRPDIKVILTSGYPAEVHEMDPNSDDFIAKPYRLEEITRKLNAIIKRGKKDE